MCPESIRRVSTQLDVLPPLRAWEQNQVKVPCELRDFSVPIARGHRKLVIDKRLEGP